MTQTSLLRVLGVTAIAMLLAVSSVAFAQTDTTGTTNADGTMQTTSATDGTTPGVPNTGAGTDPVAMALLVVAAVAAIGGAVYFLAAPRETLDQV